MGEVQRPQENKDREVVTPARSYSIINTGFKQLHDDVPRQSHVTVSRNPSE